MKYVCFDIGNVIYHVDFNPLLNKLSSRFNITKDEANKFLNNNQKRCDLGFSTIEEELSHRFAIKSDILLAEYVALWMQSIKPNYDMLYLLSSLLNDGVKIAILSNMGYEHYNELIKSFTVRDNVISFFSCFVGARKPTFIYYSIFLNLHPEFANAFYVDDLQENLDTGAKFGLRPIYFALDKRPSKNEIDAIKTKILE